MTSIKLKFVTTLFFIFLLFTSCNNNLGYEIDGEKVNYRYWNEGMGFGSETYQIIGADSKSFEILKNSDYATDKNKAYYKGKPIPNSDGKTFHVINNENYSKDKNNVYIELYTIMSANPSTFRILKVPYSRDDKKIFCGTIPMQVKNIDEFKVIGTGSFKTISRTSYFIEENKEYSFIDTLKYPWVVHCDGKGETKTEKFLGFKKIKNYR